MTEFNHTQPPWNIYFNSQDNFLIRKMFSDGQESHIVAICNSGIENALLIAAAPELLEALRDCREALRRAGNYGELAIVNAAIAKAMGVQS